MQDQPEEAFLLLVTDPVTYGWRDRVHGTVRLELGSHAHVADVPAQKNTCQGHVSN